MFDVILYEPEIPPNTGNIIRLTANMGAGLHLVQPLAFDLDDKKLRRAGLDYREWARLQVHVSLDECLQALRPVQLFALTTKAARVYSEPPFVPGTAFLFGPESRGLPGSVLDAMPVSSKLRVPMVAESRSLNLSNTVAVVLYEAWRQNGFSGGVR